MRKNLPDLARQAANLERAGLYAHAERALEVWRRTAESLEAWGVAAEAATRGVRFALDRDQLDTALARGAAALPYILGRPRIDPNIKGRLYINLTKAAWGLGREAEARAYLDAARCVIEHEAVAPLVGVHLGIAASIVALEDGDAALAAAWALQALEVAGEVADEGTVLLCRYNLSHIWRELGQFDRAAQLLAQPLAAAGRDIAIVDLLVNGIGIAIAQGDLMRAAGYAQRAVAAYCAAPSQLSPRSVAYLYEALARLHAALGAEPAAEMLAEAARAWFALRHRDRDIARVQSWLTGRRRGDRPAMEGAIEVDPDLLYAGDLLRASWTARQGGAARSLALSVNRLLPEVAPQAQVPPCENAALLLPVSVGERWFTGRSRFGQAAERVLAGADGPGQRGLKLLAGYERLAEGGASWMQSLHVLRRQGLDSEGLQVLEELHRAATA